MTELVGPAPFCTIIAGPNGSGKSTLYDLISPHGQFVNADSIARRLAPQAPETAAMAAGREVLDWIERLLSERRSFVYETTLSSRQSLSVMERARTLGYEVALAFVTLTDADLGIRRVAERVARGGHHIPAKVIRRRYETAFRRLPSALALADTALIFDNSGLDPTMLLTLDRGEVLETKLDLVVPLHRRIADAAHFAFGIEPSVLLPATPRP